MIGLRVLACHAVSSAPAVAAGTALRAPPPGTPLPECAGTPHPLGCSGAFEAARRWINASKPIREAHTAEARLRVLMQQAVEGPLDGDPSKLSEMPPVRERQRAEGHKIDGPGGLKTDQVAAKYLAPLSSGVTLFGESRPVAGCAAAAAVRVALHFPAKLQQNGMSNNINRCSVGRSNSSRLCCAASRQGAKVYVWGESDSLVVGGLLQLLSGSLNGGTPCGVFYLAGLGPSKLLRRCNLLDMLPHTRIRGFREAVELILSSTCDLLQRCIRCEVGLPLGKGPPDFNGVEGGIPVGASCTASKPDWGETESPMLPTTTAPDTIPTSVKRGTGDGRTDGAQESLGELSDPFTLSANKRGPYLRQRGEPEPAVLKERSRAALPLGGGVGSEVHVLVSGGVDSAVSLLLMREWGFRAKPVFLKVWAPEAAQLKGQLRSQHHEGTLAVAAAAAAAAAACPWREDAESAAAVAAAAGLPLEVFPMQQQYWDRVIATFIEGARSGLTLNPDWSCNSLVKFGAFAQTLGDVDSPIVSGHYARIQMDGGTPRLLRGRDLAKDQSYFLSGLSTQQLSRSLFPVGALLKSQVRKLAADWHLPSSQRPDSQGLCFLGPLPVGQFLMHLLGEKEGPIFHFPSGALVGRHKGLWAFTAGQQKGVLPLLDPRLCRRCVGAGGVPPTLSGPWSVVGKVPEANALFVVSKEEERAAEDCVRILATEARDSPKCSGGPLLEAATKTDRRALLALALRQLRTCLRVDNVRWFKGEAPPEFAASAAAHGTPFRSDGSIVAAVAASMVAAAREGAPVLVAKPANDTLIKDTNEGVGLVVQVRHSAGFHGVAKHKFKVLWASEGPSQERLSGSSSCFSVPHEAELLLEEPDIGLAPGQIAAFYRGEECVGSARISPLQGLPVLKGILDKGN
ncbi:tRNA methyltransferase domain-containing protein, putative [Eimeria praecox]|uniref:tRNA-5-taurinomethyluridine 2-sulfurtransferase n=1 Tax=Eimeria praecox TaxID=51316 RepID=U6H7D5_9EIME|nr:tRNA methyltransferase domain-containing protein, putative [Eimeria praecox]